MKAPIYKYLLPSLILISSWGLLSCNNKKIDPESIYFDYKVWGDEDAGYITTRLQYRIDGRNGSTLLLRDPAGVEIDGMGLKADSSKRNGIYYEINKPVKEFTGKHTIVFTNIDNKKYREEFSFQPISLKTDVPAELSRGDLAFDLDGLKPRDYIRVLFTDTAAFSEGIDRIDTILDGHLIVRRAQLSRLVNGPVHLEFSKEEERSIRNGTPEGGKLSISYGLKRGFILKD